MFSKLKSRWVKVVDDRYGKKVEVLNVPGVVRDGIIGFVAFIVLLWVWPFASVPTGSRGVVTQFGAIESIHNEGLAVLPPWKKISMFSVRAETADIKDAPGGTKDLQRVDTSLVVRYSIKPDQVAMVFEKYSHDGDLSSYIQTATMEVFKAVTARYDAPELISKRKQVSDDIYEALGEKVAKYGAQIANIDMRDFKFSDSYMAAINEKVTQEQLRQAAENKLLTVTAEQKQKVAIAEADANAVKAKADGNKYATITVAQGDAESTKLNAEAQSTDIRLRSQALAQAGQQYIELKRVLVEQSKADRWDGKLPENVYAGAPIPFLNAPVGK